MLEVIYRIYEVADEETAAKNIEQSASFGIFSSGSGSCNTEVVMDCIICDSRDHFKDIIRSTYGPDIPFRNTKKLKPGDLYCIIIGEHCYNTEQYFNKVSFVCDECGATMTTYLNRPIKFDKYELNSKFYGIEEYAKKRFCSYTCKYAYSDRESKKIMPEDDQEFFITRDMFTQNYAGYIYKITKKSTDEFYVGQTRYAPIFRWGEHLHTARFPISEIVDYKFEVIEIVPQGTNILEREKYWIQKLYLEHPEKSLNIALTKNLIKEQEDT